MRRPSARKCFFAFTSLAIVYLLLSLVGVQIGKSESESELTNNPEWIAESKSWVDRQVCRWLGLCGTMHMLYSSRWTWPHVEKDVPLPTSDSNDYWYSDQEEPASWSKEEIKRRKIPQYVLDHAPYVHLFSGEQFWPCDIADHLQHTTPFLNYTKIEDLTTDSNLTNLNELNDYEKGEHSRFVYLQSLDNVEERPKWLVGSDGIPQLPAKNDGDLDLDYPWPDTNEDLRHFDLEGAKQAALDEYFPTSGEIPAEILPTDRTASLDGRCGGNSAQTCKGSRFGQCCSIYGWCGSGDDFCDEACDPLAGECYDPFNPPRGPHPDLRKREDLQSKRHRPQPGGKSSAPAILIVVHKPGGITDAFWFFFYSFNLGQTVLNIRFGNHVGDWEHTAIRFRNGQPTQVFLSEHNFGNAYTWSAVEKYLPAGDASGTMIGSWSNSTAAKEAKRPVVYSALGSHAMYGTPGLHPYILPAGLLHDETDRGPLWDPRQNFKAFTYDSEAKVVRAATTNPSAPTGWFDFAGHWGDKFYGLGDPRQYRFVGQYHYVNGPSGPRFKNLGRKGVCQGRGKVCKVHDWLGGRTKGGDTWEGDEGDEEGGLPGGNSTDEVW
ncbi:related to VPS62 Vacuolar Protein Sorting [Ramularia collo-cygni]|uniref:Related to VPS62 Vacuolar Protein Sorting n=1 Tax=Ramularia collo-cygni TaxID=112498 RepID=A0A2D3UQS6_9PEZI|nr:related to VPS62 Vacuolar Protein Sorting [Ramularia collo-cygni]CZT14620.1 related to VPS62 Vacuolar Protein Sorting [Ramularia collo-cygni]